LQFVLVSRAICKMREQCHRSQWTIVAATTVSENRWGTSRWLGFSFVLVCQQQGWQTKCKVVCLCQQYTFLKKEADLQRLQEIGNVESASVGVVFALNGVREV
jgi:hypothetical protein